MKTLEERKAILEGEITKQLKKGWQILSRSETGCQLIQDENQTSNQKKFKSAIKL